MRRFARTARVQEKADHPDRQKPAMSQVVWDKDTLDSFVQQAKTERELSPIPYGTRVLLRGLIAKPELNGQ